jgi:hypothetical protein
MDGASHVINRILNPRFLILGGLMNSAGLVITRTQFDRIKVNDIL